jgi:hypothetical protein
MKQIKAIRQKTAFILNPHRGSVLGYFIYLNPVKSDNFLSTTNLPEEGIAIYYSLFVSTLPKSVK